MGVSSEFIIAVFGAIFGGLGTYFSENHVRKKDSKSKTQHSSSILFFDLKSIEAYFVDADYSVNIRYTENWQSLLSDCEFLNSQDIKFLYKIYDGIYNFNFYFTSTSELLEDSAKNVNILRSLVINNCEFAEVSKKIQNYFINGNTSCCEKN